MTKRYQPHQEFHLPKRPPAPKLTSWWATGGEREQFRAAAQAQESRMRATSTTNAHVVEAIGSKTPAAPEEM